MTLTRDWARIWMGDVRLDPQWIWDIGLIADNRTISV